MADATRNRIIKVAHDLFYRLGFHTVGLDAILSDVGVTKTTFYNHFDSKEDLVYETLRFHDRWWQDTFREMLKRHGGDTPRGQLSAIFDALDEILARDDFNGCYFVNAAVQFPSAHDPAHQAAATHKRAMEAIIRELAGYAGASEPAVLARELSLVMEGSYVTRQVTGDTTIGRVAAKIAQRVIEAHLPAKPAND